MLLNKYGMGKTASVIMPKDVPGCVLSLIAKQANKGQNPASNLLIWSDRSNARTNYNYTNLVSNGNFSDGLTNWTQSGGVNSASNNVLTSTANGSVLTAAALQTTTTPCIAAHKIYARAKLKVTNADCLDLKLRAFTGVTTDFYSVNNPVNGQNYDASGIVTIPGSPSGNVQVSIRQRYVDAATANGKQCEIQQVLLTDLTALGLDALTVAQCDAIFSFTATSNISSMANDCYLANQAGTAASGFNSEVINDRTVYYNRLDGVDDYGALINTPFIDITTNEFAISATFRITAGSTGGYFISKNLDNGATSQYSMQYLSASKRLELLINGALQSNTPTDSIIENAWYNVIFYRKADGTIKPYLNKVEKPNGDFIGALISQPNMRMGARSSNLGGTTHASFLKGDIATQSIYHAPALDIEKIIAAEMNISYEFTGVI